MKFRSMRATAALFAAASPFAIGTAHGQSVTPVHIVTGTAQITSGQNGHTITQSTRKAVIEWQDFSVDEGGLVRFIQPDSNAITLNRVTGSQRSRINGTIEANGQVWLLNPNGVMIGNQGRISAAGFLATTSALSNEDFLAGTFTFGPSGAATGQITNAGTITTAGGYTVLAGGQIRNSGLIEAGLGQIALGAGKGFTLDLHGDKLLSFAVTSPLDAVPLEGAAIDNSGTLRADGGRILLSARAAANVIDNVINTSGLIQAQSARIVNGQIILDGGDAGTVRVNGVLDVSGTKATETGGTAAVLGNTIILGDSSQLLAQGTSGGGNIFVGGGWQGESIFGRPSAVRVAATAGAYLDASALDRGNGGTVVLWSDIGNLDSQTHALGSFYAKGGVNGGDGGRIETSGYYLSTFGARGAASAAWGKAGLWLFDPVDIDIVEGNANGGSFVDNGDGQSWSPIDAFSSIAAGDIETLLNNGTNVTITTAFPGTGEGTISVYAPINKSAGTEATLSLVADESIYIYSGIGSTAGLNLSLETVNGRIVVGSSIEIDGDLTARANSGYVWTPGEPASAFFMNEGPITARNVSITAPELRSFGRITASDRITLMPSSTTQDIILGADSEGQFAISTETLFNLYAPNLTIGRADGSNLIQFALELDGTFQPEPYPGEQQITVQSGGAGGVINFAGSYAVEEGSLLRLIAGSHIELAADTAITIGGRLDLLSGDSIENLAGATALTTSGDGRWFIHAASPDDVTFGGMISGQHALWGTEFAGAIAAADADSGNRYSFGNTPTLTISASDREKPQGQGLTFTVNDYTVEGLVNAEAYGGVFEQDTLGAAPLIFSTGAASSAAVGNYEIQLDFDALPSGYSANFSGGTLTVVGGGGGGGGGEQPPIDPPVETPDRPAIPLPDAITGGVYGTLPPLPTLPPLATPSPPSATPSAPPAATAISDAPTTSDEGPDSDPLTFLIAPQIPLNPLPESPVSSDQPATPRDLADSDDPFLPSAEDRNTDDTPPSEQRQGGTVDPLAPGVGLDVPRTPLPSEIPGIESRYSGTGDTNKW